MIAHNHSLLMKVQDSPYFFIYGNKKVFELPINICVILENIKFL